MLNEFARIVARWFLPAGAAAAIFYFLRVGTPSHALLMIAVLVSGYTVTLGIAYAVGRKRPYETIMNDGHHLVPWIYTPSFPSGHAMGSFVIAGSMVIAGAPLGIIVVFYIVAVLTALSRVVVGVHYVTDVIVGALLGVMANSILMFILATVPELFPEL